MEYRIYAGLAAAYSVAVLGLGGYLHYRYGSKVKAAGAAAVAALKQ